MRCAIIHYHELALKGRNRDYFEQQLVRNIQRAVRDLGVKQIENLRSRIRVILPPDVDGNLLRQRLTRVCGVANFSLAEGVSLDLLKPDFTQLTESLVDQLRAHPFSSFRVTAKRADKRLPLTSMDVERLVGAAVHERTGKPVNLKRPDLTIYVELLTKDMYVSIDKEPGPGGMPVGVSGTVACLISGGIDSPVAAYRMIKRGCRAVFVHFSGRPLVSRASEDKVRELVQTLSAYFYDAPLYVIPFGEIQREIVLNTPAPFRVVLYRRMMIRIAQELGRRERCWGLVTGDSLGQVASQTPENLSVIEDAATLPILRPLIGMDKIEITDEAKRIGTYETSIEPDQDCCKLFTPPHPSTKTDLEELKIVEQALDIPKLLRQGLDKAERSDVTFPA